MMTEFLPALKKHLIEKLGNLYMDKRPDEIVNPYASPPASDALVAKPCATVAVHIGDLPPKRREAGQQGRLDDDFPCIIIVPTNGQTGYGEDVVTVALICGIYCGESGDAEAAEMDCAILLSNLKRILKPLETYPLECKFMLQRDSKGALFPWQKSDMQARPYMQATMMTEWRMKGF